MRYGFTGHAHDALLGLVDMGGRMYDAQLGRFLSADPIVQAPTNLQSHNRYSYVWNNPLAMVDPSGFQGCRSGVRAETVVGVATVAREAKGPRVVKVMEVRGHIARVGQRL